MLMLQVVWCEIESIMAYYARNELNCHTLVVPVNKKLILMYFSVKCTPENQQIKTVVVFISNILYCYPIDKQRFWNLKN